MTVREELEWQEHKRLNPLAAFADQSRGRLRFEEPRAEDVRTCYQRDIDRIVHSKSFRRLMHKTQVFLSPEGDHYRTRMTHTLEGAIISMPLRAEGESKGKAFLGGVLSGVVEPIGAVLTILAAQLVIPALPYFLSFAAGAMLYVVVEELIPEMSQGRHSNLGTVFFAVGFSIMMVLDVALG